MKNKFSLRGINGDIELDFSKEVIENLEDFDGTLVIPYYNKNYVMTYHPKRNGWEFPAGSREGNESAQECAKRETFEETGAILKNLKPIGCYWVTNDDNTFKTIIFKADVEGFEPKPRWSETDLVKLFDELPNNISYKDDVFKITLEQIKICNDD